MRRYLPSRALRLVSTLTALTVGPTGCSKSVRSRPVDAATSIPDATTAYCPDVRTHLTRQTFRADIEVTVDGGSRQFDFSSTAPQRPGHPGDGRRTVREEPGGPRVESGDPWIDGLFALAVAEAKEAAVTSITDTAFQGGQPVECDCFETGENWRYVWTRDTAYAAELGIAWLDASRARRSLEFKLSAPAPAASGDSSGLDEPEEIVQDTGSGGSWPVSTDRVVWARGARRVLALLGGLERQTFARRALAAALQTAERDRRHVYDSRSGLYRGEQSFLDWREQSYPSWTAADVTTIASSQALSTNVGHLALLRLIHDLAIELDDDELAKRFQARSADLAAAIHERLWLGGGDGWATFIASQLDPSPVRRRDLLGQSLAVLEGLGGKGERARAVASYPRSEEGPPVQWPQQPRTPIYHNRGAWPFVTAYSLLAAAEVGNPAVFDADLSSLIRGAAFHLSHMEVLEFETGASHVEDGDFSGPVVNSRRQLWSVAGFVGAVTQGIFGLDAQLDGIQVAPFLTAETRRRFGNRPVARLVGLPYRGARLDVELVLPACADSAQDGVYDVEEVTFAGDPVEGGFVPAESLTSGGTLRIVFGDLLPSSTDDSITLIAPDAPRREIFSPVEPEITEIAAQGDDLLLTIDTRGEEPVALEIYRDGERVADEVLVGAWRDETVAKSATRTYCYSAVSRYRSTGTRSHHSRPVCFWGSDRVVEIPARQLSAKGGQLSSAHGREHLENWGAPHHSLEASSFTPAFTGRWGVQLVYANGAGPINTGVSAGVKRVTVRDSSNQIVAEDTVVLPHTGDWSAWSDSTIAFAQLSAGTSYRIQIEDVGNMSYLDHFSRYSGPGGGPGLHNHVAIASMKLLYY